VPDAERETRMENVTLGLRESRIRVLSSRVGAGCTQHTSIRGIGPPCSDRSVSSGSLRGDNDDAKSMGEPTAARHRTGIVIEPR
jgi:hypothetical protein